MKGYHIGDLVREDSTGNIGIVTVGGFMSVRVKFNEELFTRWVSIEYLKRM